MSTHDPGRDPRRDVKLVSMYAGSEQTPSKQLYPDVEQLSTVGRRQARMRQLYAHTAELHPDRPDHSAAAAAALHEHALAQHARSHVYGSRAELLQHPLLAPANQNAPNTSTDLRYVCRLCGLDERACSHAYLGGHEQSTRTQQSPSAKANNYSV